MYTLPNELDKFLTVCYTIKLNSPRAGGPEFFKDGWSG